MRKIPWGLVLLLVATVFGGAVVLVVAIGMWSFSRTPDGKAIFKTIVHMPAVAAAGQRGPGVKELRNAGCSQAAVFEGDDYRRAIGAPDGSTGPSAYVVCQPLYKHLTCEQVAAIYVGVPEIPAGDFEVTSHVPPDCHQLYSRSGDKIRDLPVER